MRRRYRTELYRGRIEYIKNKIPNASIGVDVIVGFPGESDDHFQQTYEFINSLDVSYLHVFTYSERPRTTALRIEEVVPVPKRSERNKQLRILSLKKQRAHYEKFIGSSRPVLFEQAENEGLLFGYTPEYVRVAIPSDQVTANNQTIVSLDIINPDGYVLASNTE